MHVVVVCMRAAAARPACARHWLSSGQRSGQYRALLCVLRCVRCGAHSYACMPLDCVHLAARLPCASPGTQAAPGPALPGCGARAACPLPTPGAPTRWLRLEGPKAGGKTMTGTSRPGRWRSLPDCLRTTTCQLADGKGMHWQQRAAQTAVPVADPPPRGSRLLPGCRAGPAAPA